MQTNLPELHWFGPGFEDTKQCPVEKPEAVILYVHGWGVKWPSKGLFTDLVKKLSDSGVVSALLDMSEFDSDGNASFLPLEAQQQRVLDVAEHIASNYPSTKLVVLGHSLGARVVTTISRKLSNYADSFILLAPPLGKRASKPKKRMLRHQGSYQTPDGGIIYPRKDGTNSRVTKEFITSFNQDWNMVFGRNLSTINKKLIVLAEHDDRSEDQEEILAELGATLLTDSDHNFTGDSTDELADLIQAFI